MSDNFRQLGIDLREKVAPLVAKAISNDGFQGDVAHEVRQKAFRLIQKIDYVAYLDTELARLYNHMKVSREVHEMQGNNNLLKQNRDMDEIWFQASQGKGSDDPEKTITALTSVHGGNIQSLSTMNGKEVGFDSIRKYNLVPEFVDSCNNEFREYEKVYVETVRAIKDEVNSLATDPAQSTDSYINYQDSAFYHLPQGVLSADDMPADNYRLNKVQARGYIVDGTPRESKNIPFRGEISDIKPPEKGNSSYQDKILNMAKELASNDIPYAFGGGNLEGPSRGKGWDNDSIKYEDYLKSGYDCSSLVQHLYYQATGDVLARTSQEQYASTVPIEGNNPQIGDLGFPPGGSPGHVVMYTGDNTVFEAPESGTNLQYSKAKEDYEWRRPEGSPNS